jgi:hypothetical protein
MQSKENASQSSLLITLITILLLIISAFVALGLHLKMIGGVLGVTPDSLNYLKVAQNILAGRGFIAFNEPLTHWPPGYSILIALMSILRGGDVFRGAYWVQVLLIFTNTLLVGVAVWLASGKRLLAVIVGIALFLISGPILKLHAMIWSEALFITLMLSAFIVFSAYVCRRRLLPIIITGIVVGMAIMVRYAGVTLVAPFLFYLLFLDTLPVSKRIQRSVLLTILAILPISIWTIRNLLVAGSAYDRGFGFVPFGADAIQQMINVLYDFWISYNIRPWLSASSLILILGLLVVGCIYIYSRYQPGEGWKKLTVYWQTSGLVFTIVYILFILFTLLFIDYSTTIDSRMFSSVYVMLVITILSEVSTIADASQQKGIWWIFVVMIAYLLFIRADKAIDTYYDIQTNGRGFTSAKWDNSPVIRYIGNLPEQLTIYSNGADVIWFKTGKDAVMLPSKVIGQARPNPAYLEELKPVCRELITGEAVLVEFSKIDRPYMPTASEVAQICGSLVLETINEGVVLESR